MDEDTDEPLGMAHGREGNGLEHFFSRFNKENKQTIKFLGVDRSNAYKATAVKHLPHDIVCYDAYHLVSNMNEVLDKIRRATMKHPPCIYFSFLEEKRFVWLRDGETFNPDIPVRENASSALPATRKTPRTPHDYYQQL